MQANISLIFYIADFGGFGRDVHQIFWKGLLEMLVEIEHRRFLLNTNIHSLQILALFCADFAHSKFQGKNGYSNIGQVVPDHGVPLAI